MKQTLLRLSLRERRLLVGGIAVLLILGLYAFLYLPIINEQQRLTKAIGVQQDLNRYLQGVGTEIAGLIPEPKNPETADLTQSLISIIDNSSEQSGIKPAIKRLVPEGQDKVMLWLEHCNFDDLMAWLAMNEQIITVQQIAISREPGKTGSVSGKLLLGRQ